MAIPDSVIEFQRGATRSPAGVQWLGGRVFLALCCLVMPALATAQHFPPDEDLSLIVRYLVEDTGVSGLVVGVLEADGASRVVAHGSGGEGTEPLGPRSGFQIASITKVFTAALLADMVIRGELTLDDPVARFLPAEVRVPSRNGREITLLDLATHRSGLPPNPPGVPMRGDDPMARYTVEDLYAFLSAHELRGVPGAGYRYSNLGYGLLGHALARANGTSFRAALRERVFRPLGMERTDIAVAGELEPWMTRGHRGGVMVPHWYATEALQGAGAAVSTAEDLLIFLAAGIRESDSPMGRAIRMTQEVRVEDGDRGAGWGFSWRTGVLPDGSLIRGHGGEAGGFRTRIAFAPERGIGVVVLANEVGLSTDLETMLLRLDPPPEGWTDHRPDPVLLATYAGRYMGESAAAEYFLRVEPEGHLTFQESDGARIPLRARSDSTFYSLAGPWSFTFRSGPDGGGVTLIMREDIRSRSREPLEQTALRISADAPPPARIAGAAVAPPEPRGRRRGLFLLGVVVALGVAGVLLARRTGRA